MDFGGPLLFSILYSKGSLGAQGPARRAKKKVSTLGTVSEVW